MPQSSAGESFVREKEGTTPGRGVGGVFGMDPITTLRLQFLPWLKISPFPQNQSKILKKLMELSWTQCGMMEKPLEKLPGCWSSFWCHRKVKLVGIWMGKGYLIKKKISGNSSGVVWDGFGALWINPGFGMLFPPGSRNCPLLKL